MSDCVFCSIVGGGGDASFVYRDETVAAFMSLHPVTPGHTLVVPARHTAFLSDLDLELGGHLFQTAMRVAQAIRDSTLRCDGINFFLADGAVAGQEVLHLHLHVIPRFPGDGFKFPPDLRVAARAALDEAAERIRDAMR